MQPGCWDGTIGRIPPTPFSPLKGIQSQVCGCGQEGWVGEVGAGDNGCGCAWALGTEEEPLDSLYSLLFISLPLVRRLGLALNENTPLGNFATSAGDLQTLHTGRSSLPRVELSKFALPLSLKITSHFKYPPRVL